MKISAVDDDAILALAEYMLGTKHCCQDEIDLISIATERIIRHGLLALGFDRITELRIAVAFSDRRNFDHAFAYYTNGHGIAAPVILRYLGQGDPKKSPLNLRVVRSALAFLRQTGLLTKIVKRTQLK